MTTSHQIEDLAAVPNTSLRESFDSETRAVFDHLVLLLAERHPVSPERLAAALGRSPEEIATTLRQLPSIELDELGNVVGAGLTLRPTPHHFTINGRTMFTWCALDALLFPGLLGRTVQVESPCVTTGIAVRMKVTPDGIGQVEPADAVVSFVIPEASADIRRAFCDYVNFFSSKEAASEWLSEHPGATNLPVNEAYQVGQHPAKSFLGIKEENGPGSQI